MSRSAHSGNSLCVASHVRPVRLLRPRRIERTWNSGRSSRNPSKQRSNVAPTTGAPEGNLELLEARWGLVPSW